MIAFMKTVKSYNIMSYIKCTYLFRKFFQNMNGKSPNNFMNSGCLWMVTNGVELEDESLGLGNVMMC